VFIAERRTFVDDAAIDTPSQVLDEAAEDHGIDVTDGTLKVDGDLSHLLSSPPVLPQLPHMMIARST
jgi:hypothetical protein